MATDFSQVQSQAGRKLLISGQFLGTKHTVHFEGKHSRLLSQAGWNRHPHRDRSIPVLGCIVRTYTHGVGVNVVKPVNSSGKPRRSLLCASAADAAADLQGQATGAQGEVRLFFTYKSLSASLLVSHSKWLSQADNISLMRPDYRQQR